MNVTFAILAAALAAEPSSVPVAGAAPSESSGATAAPTAAEALAGALGRADALWSRRDLPGQLELLEAALQSAATLAPGSSEVLWRQARLLVWRAEEPGLPKERKSALGKEAWTLGDAASAAAPGRVEGWFYAMTGVGAYSQGLGILSALTQGMEGKFKERLARAEQLDPGFQAGAIPTAWGRFWYELPWPKHDAGKSLAALEAALALNPANVRARVYLADLHASEGRKGAAVATYRAALEQAPGRYDAPEERRWQAVARGSLERLEKK